MAGKVGVIISLCLLACVLSACAMGTEDDAARRENKISCWATMEETGLEQIRLRVRLEDIDGNVPTGARVLLETPEHEISWVYFSSASNMYESTLSSAASGTYTVSVNSAAGNSTISIPLVSLTEKPEIITIQDANGTAAGQGQSLTAASAISAEWESVEGATVYKGTVTNGAFTSYVFSSLTNSFLVPPGTLPAGKTYYLSVEAQYIHGDPYLREQNYYAFSYSESPDYAFTLK